MSDDAPPLSLGLSVSAAATQRPSLPRMREAREDATALAVESVAVPVAPTDNQSEAAAPLHAPLFNAASTQRNARRAPPPLSLASARPLALLLARLDVAERCRWSGLIMGVFYIVTVLLWPSLFVSFLGIVCGCTGFTACLEPYSVRKIMWVLVYLFLNVAMALVLAWTVLDQLVLHPDETASVNYMYTAAFVGFAAVVHARSTGLALQVIRQCQLVSIMADAALPESWRRRWPRQRQQQSTHDEAHTPLDQAAADHQAAAAPDREQRASSMHSFELDVEGYRDASSVLSPEPSPSSASSLSSPASSFSSSAYHRLQDTT